MNWKKSFYYTSLGALSLIASSVHSQDDFLDTPDPNALATPGTPKAGKAKGPIVGDYVELDNNIKNEIYGTVDFQNSELKDIIKAISRMAGKNFILDKKIENKRITIMSPEPVTKQEAYNAFMSALYTNGLAIVSLGKFLKIIEVKDASNSNIRVFSGDYIPNSEEVVTALYSLKYLDAEELQRFLTDLVPRSGRINYYPNTNTLVMTDTGVNLRRVVSILKSLDVPGHEDQLASIPVQYASAKSLGTLIDDILDSQGSSTRTGGAAGARRGGVKKTRGGGVISKIVPDERTNSLIVSANGRGVQEVRDLVRQLDTKASSGGNIHVYYCKNAQAEDLATTLNSLVQNKNQGSNAATTPGGGFFVPRPTTPTTTTGSARSAGEGISLEGNIKITADKSTNSLVIIASGSDFTSLKQVIEKLDLPRRQVYVEATIMEIVVANNNEAGIATNVAGPGVARIGGFSPGIGADVLSIFNPKDLTGMVAGFTSGAKYDVALDPTKPGNTVKISSVTGLIRLLASTTQAQILHTPQILTSDNQDSEIKVTNKIKTASTTVVNSGGNVSQSQTFETQQVVLSLKVKPQIGEDNDLIKLDVEQSIDNFADAAYAQGQVDVTERKVKNTVVVRNGDSVVVGGLQKTDISDTRAKIPFLGDIPLIGWLFKGKKSNVRRANLVLFLTPHIIRDYSDILKITSRKIDERMEVGKSIKDPPKDMMKSEVEALKKRNQEDLAKPQTQGWNFAPKPVSEETEKKADASDALAAPPALSPNETPAPSEKL